MRNKLDQKEGVSLTQWKIENRWIERLQFYLIIWNDQVHRNRQNQWKRRVSLICPFVQKGKKKVGGSFSLLRRFLQVEWVSEWVRKVPFCPSHCLTFIRGTQLKSHRKCFTNSVHPHNLSSSFSSSFLYINIYLFYINIISKTLQPMPIILEWKQIIFIHLFFFLFHLLFSISFLLKS